MNTMNTQTQSMNKGAVAASRTIDAIANLPGKVFRFPGKVVRNINTGLHNFWSDFRSLRAEVKREKKQGLDRIRRALALVDEARSEKAEALKETQEMAAQNIRDAKAVVDRTRESVNRRVKLATERMADQKAIAKMEREAEEITGRIDQYEQRISELEEQLYRAHVKTYDASIVEDDNTDEVQSESPTPTTEEEVKPTGKGFKPLVTIVDGDIEAEEVKPTG